MSDTTVPTVPTAEPLVDFDAYMASHTAYQERAASLVAGNKAALFEALTAAGITHVTVAFDGYGDSGQIENVDTFSGEGLVKLPDIEVTIASACWGDPGIVAETMTLYDAIERLAYDFLASAHGG